MQELESKYLLGHGRKPDKVARRLLQDLVWAGFSIHPKGTRLVEDVYYDTPDRRLQRAGWSLRARVCGPSRALTAKQLATGNDGYYERREIEQLAMTETPSLDSLGAGPVLDLLRRFLPPTAELVALFTQQNQRTTWRLGHPDAPRSGVELVLDRVRVEGDGDLQYVEFEGEHDTGGSTLQAEFAAVLEAQPGLVAARSSKFQRGLLAIGEWPRTADRSRALMTPDHPWAELVASYLAEQVRALKAYEPHAWEGLHDEGVHQMRIATRRLRAGLSALDDVLPGDRTGALAEEVSWLCDVLGDVRDLDVQIAALRRYRAQLGRGSRHLQRYERRLRKARIRARAALVAALQGERYRSLLERCARVSELVEELAADQALSIHDFAERYVPRRLKDIRKAGRRIGRDSSARELHRLRILIKKLRYELEILQGPYGEPLTRATTRLRKLQGRLGDHQDAWVARRQLARFRKREARSKKERAAFTQLMTLEARKAEAKRRRLRRDWRRFEAESKGLAAVFDGPVVRAAPPVDRAG